MTFLKKLGQIIAQLAGAAVGIGPIIAPFLGGGKTAAVVTTGINDLTAIAKLTLTIEAAFASVPNSTGAQKLQALVPLVSNIISTSEVVSGKKVADPATFTKGCTEVAQGMVDILNSISPDAAQHS
jgi:hypothetical protein